MSVSHPTVKAVPAALLSLSALLALSISLLLTACGMYPSDSFVPRRKRAGYTLVVFGAVTRALFTRILAHCGSVVCSSTHFCTRA
jgi:hypothetical protein